MALASTFLQEAVDASNLTTYTFASQNLGTASSDRQIVVCATVSVATPSESISSVTVAGVTASPLVTKNLSGSTTRFSGIYIASVPTGTSGDVVVTGSIAMARCGIALYHLTGAQSTAYDFDTDEDNTGTSTTGTLDIPAGGVCIAMNSTSAGAAVTTSWTNLSTEDFDMVIEGVSSFSGASEVFGSLQTGRTITSTTSGSVNTVTLVVVSIAEAAGINYPLTAAPGSFSLTGFDAILNSARSMIASAGTFTLTGIDTIFNRGYMLLAETGYYILTGFNARIKTSLWVNIAKNLVNFVNGNKNNANFSNTTKNTETFSNQTKNNENFSNTPKNNGNWTNQSKS